MLIAETLACLLSVYHDANFFTLLSELVCFFSFDASFCFCVDACACFFGAVVTGVSTTT